MEEQTEYKAGTDSNEHRKRQSALSDLLCAVLNGWLSPAGKFYECAVCGHQRLARSIIFGGDDKVPLDDEHWPRNAEREMEVAGWYKLATMSDECNRSSEWYGDDATQKQMDFIFDWCVFQGKKYKL